MSEQHTYTDPSSARRAAKKALGHTGFTVAKIMLTNGKPGYRWMSPTNAARAEVQKEKPKLALFKTSDECLAAVRKHFAPETPRGGTDFVMHKTVRGEFFWRTKEDDDRINGGNGQAMMKKLQAVAKPKTAKEKRAPKKERAKRTGEHGSKTALIATMLKRPNGCTSKEVLEATGWPSVSMPAAAKAAGVKLAKEKKQGEVTRYRAA